MSRSGPGESSPRSSVVPATVSDPRDPRARRDPPVLAAGRSSNRATACAKVFTLLVLSVTGIRVRAADLPAPVGIPPAISNLDSGLPAIVFTQGRGTPLTPAVGLVATHGKPGTVTGAPSYSGSARPGEFHVFQIGLDPLRDSGPVQLTFDPLIGLEAGSIPETASRCLSLGGIDGQGRPFGKSIRLQRGRRQVLWVGVQIPEAAHGTYSGVAHLAIGTLAGDANGPSMIPVRMTLRVEGHAVNDGGDSEARNLSRLRWLDSTVGSEPTLTAPFIAVTASNRTVRVLGRELTLGEDGLPRQTTSYFSPANTHLQENGRPLLAGPVSFRVETADGPMHWDHEFQALQATPLEATWTARSRADGLLAQTRGTLDFTGSGTLRIHLTASRTITLKDLHLDLPLAAGAARYFMGLNHPGGRRTEDIHWRWDVAKHQDCFWIGDVNAGLMLRFKDAEYLRPPVNIYYAFRPLTLPESWGNRGRGGIDIAEQPNQVVLARAASGPRELERGHSLDFDVDFYLTPFRPLDTGKQWSTRFTHLGGPGRQAIDDAVATADPKHGPNVVNVHHASYYSPYINYPYSDDSFPAFRELVARAHARGVRLRVYYTTREITQNMPELFPLHSFNGEIILPGPGPDARTLLHPNGPAAWLKENLREQFIPAWEAKVGPPYAEQDLSVITTPDSRWNNFYLEGLRWLVEKSDFDGMYIDDTALDATSLRRARRILDRRPGRLIDLHTWNHFNSWAGFANNLNLYMEVLPYLDRLWLGEGFDAGKATPDFWLVEMSGLPFGVMSEMLDGANPWRGMVFGETARLPWSGDPRGLWKVWDEYGIQGTEFLPYFVANAPVRLDSPGLLASAFRRPGRTFVALASWAAKETEAVLQCDWNSLGLDPTKATIYAPPIQGMQTESSWKPGQPIPVAPGRGWFLVIDETPRQVR